MLDEGRLCLPENGLMTGGIKELGKKTHFESQIDVEGTCDEEYALERLGRLKAVVISFDASNDQILWPLHDLLAEALAASGHYLRKAAIFMRWRAKLSYFAIVGIDGHLLFREKLPKTIGILSHPLQKA